MIGLFVSDFEKIDFWESIFCEIAATEKKKV